VLPEDLPPREAAVFRALAEAGGRVLSRSELTRAAGLAGLSPRRVDSVLVALRRRLPPGTVLTVRGRGWALARPDSVG
jgi:DNA-binding response OmpR family regulator